MMMNNTSYITQGNSLESPMTQKYGESFTSSTGLECGASGMQGWRVEMEDAHIAVDIPSKPNHLFLGVWDGHAGDGAAKYAADNLVNVLQSTREWKLYLENGEENVDLLSQALIEAFLKIDISIKAFQESTLGEDTSGCTSVTAIVTPKFIICANAGDSRCVMGSNGESMQLSDDHKPTLLIERTRIENAGGIVQWGRVDGDLAVSRALGDFGYKDRPDLPQDAQKVTNDCFITLNTLRLADDRSIDRC